jgi:ABC-2 type transport system permease protein
MMCLRKRRVTDAAASASRARVWAVIRLEWLTQRREPLTVLYMLVFFALACAFAARGPVELVGSRGLVPRDAPWSIALASTALTAFGQVITTMVAATVVLRDAHDRVHELIGTTQLTSREYLLGKLVASLVLLCAIYCAIPIGLCVGAAVAGGSPASALRGSLPPFLLIVLPTMLAVGALQFAAGVLSGRLWLIVAQGLALIWLWTGVTGAAGAADTPSLIVMFDPFGSAPLLHDTQRWSDAERAALPMPVSALLLANRALWLGLAGTIATFAVRRAPNARRQQRVPDDGNSRMTVPAASVRTPSLVASADVMSVGGVRAAVEVARYVARWTLRDAGWRVLTALGMLNVGVHAVTDAAAARTPVGVSAAVIATVLVHGRLFLILLATIYAGELVWRERDERSAPLFDALPIRDGALMSGSVAGAVLAQTLVVAMLTLAVAVSAAVGSGTLPAITLVSGAVARVWLPAIGWLLAAIAVHVLVQQKVVAHLLCIAGWTLASVLLDAAVPAPLRAPSPMGTVIIFLSLLGLVVVVRPFWHRGDSSQVAAWLSSRRLRGRPR